MELYSQNIILFISIIIIYLYQIIYRIFIIIMLNRYKCNLEHEIMMKSRMEYFHFSSDFYIYHHVFIGIFDDIFSIYNYTFKLKLYHKIFGYFIFYKIIIYNNCQFGTYGKYFHLKSCF